MPDALEQTGRSTVADENNRPPLVVALEWVSKITAVALEMVLPGILGHWLDQRWGTGFLALLGFGIGMTVGIWHLIRLTGTGKTQNGSRPNSEKDRDG